MHQLTYISTARAGLGNADIDAILAASRRNNRRDGLTGLLIFDGKRFLQSLEGFQPLVEAAFVRIKADPRHRAAVMLSLRAIDAPEFGSWDMACERVGEGPDGGSVADTVDALVANVPDANTRAVFMGFARIDRAKAA